MANIRKFFQNLLPRQSEKDSLDNWWHYHTVLGTMEDCELFNNENAYRLALMIAEIFMPVDAIADRVATLPYVKQNKNGEIVDFSQSEQRLMNQPNIFSTMEQLIYSLVFSELADGNSYLYTKMPDSYKTIATDRISSLWCLRPDKVDICVNTHAPALFSITKISDLIGYYSYSLTGDKLNPDFIIHSRNQPLRIEEGTFKAQSPLMAVYKNVNNLLAVYNARYNVYKNNGIAGIITKKAAGSNLDLEQTLNPVSGKTIADELMTKYDLAGHNNIKALMSIPVDFIKTLATINELEPFRETWVDFTMIASIYGVKKELLPRETDTTFSNQKDAEIFLYQNVIKGIAEDTGRMLTKAMGITDGSIVPIFDNVECLQEDRKTNLEADAIELENLRKMQELGEDTSDLVKQIKNKYEKS